jgi:alpha-beta hydrolase superfamily lysophospholipase
MMLTVLGSVLSLATTNGSVPVTTEGTDRSHVVVLSFDRNEDGRFPRLAAWLRAAGFTTIAPDLPGHGASHISSRDATVAQMASTLQDVIMWASRATTASAS